VTARRSSGRARTRKATKSRAAKGPDRRDLLASTEAAFYRAVNAVLEPAIRAGLGAPRLSPAGFLVVEMTGRKSGKLRRVPLAALRLGDHVLIGTVRGERSLWVRNLAANGDARVWLRGRAREVHAFVLRPSGSDRAPRALTSALRPLWHVLAAAAQRGFAFALLAPRGRSMRARAAARARASRRATRSRRR
jgi:deazaflavin-dependent oxidoreductase (nitroreductase family)